MRFADKSAIAKVPVEIRSPGERREDLGERRRGVLGLGAVAIVMEILDDAVTEMRLRQMDRAVGLATNLDSKEIRDVVAYNCDFESDSSDLRNDIIELFPIRSCEY